MLTYRLQGSPTSAIRILLHVLGVIKTVVIKKEKKIAIIAEKDLHICSSGLCICFL